MSKYEHQDHEKNPSSLLLPLLTPENCPACNMPPASRSAEDQLFLDNTMTRSIADFRDAVCTSLPNASRFFSHRRRVSQTFHPDFLKNKPEHFHNLDWINVTLLRDFLKDRAPLAIVLGAPAPILGVL